MPVSSSSRGLALKWNRVYYKSLVFFFILESELEILFDDHINILSKQSKMVMILVWMLSYLKWFDVMGGVKTLLIKWLGTQRAYYWLQGWWLNTERYFDAVGKKTLVNAFSLIIVGSRKWDGSRKWEVGSRKREVGSRKSHENLEVETKTLEVVMCKSVVPPWLLYLMLSS